MFHVSDDGDHKNENNETKWQENSCSLSMFAVLVVLGDKAVIALTFSMTTVFSKGALRVVNAVADANLTRT